VAVNRFVLDVVTPEPLPKSVQRRIQRELSNYYNGVINIDLEHLKADPDLTTVESHRHQSTEDMACPYCIRHAQDQKI
jgi:hypothetical protein